jgi:hypothetical protein
MHFSISTAEPLYCSTNPLDMSLALSAVREGESRPQEDSRPATTPHDLEDSFTHSTTRYEPDTAPLLPRSLSQELDKSAAMAGVSKIVTSQNDPRRQTDDYRGARAHPVRSIAVVFKQRVEIMYNMSETPI